jgi:hypothetical protein
MSSAIRESTEVLVEEEVKGWAGELTDYRKRALEPADRAVGRCE